MMEPPAARVSHPLESRAPSVAPWHGGFGPYGATMAVIGGCSAAGWLLFKSLPVANAVMIFLAGVVFVATRYGRGPSVLASILSAVAFEFLFLPPVYSFLIAGTEYVLTFGLMLVVGLVVSRLSTRAREQTEVAGRAKLLADTEKLRNTFLASISHDLRTPLASIKGTSSLLLRSPDLEPAVRTDLIRGMHEEADFIARVVTKVLDLTRIESGSFRLRKEAYALEELVGPVTGMLEDRLKSHTLDIRLPRDLPMVPVDASLMQQALFNLLENAVTHTPAGTRIELSAARHPEGLLIEIADGGPGIGDGVEGRIFDKFYRSRTEGKRSGLGLGLALCEGVVRLHGGRIWAENRPEGGAVFRFTLPLDDGSR